MKITHEILRKKGFIPNKYEDWYLEVRRDFDVVLTEGIDNSFYPSLHQAPEMSHQEEQVVALPFIETVQQLDNLLSVVGVEQGIDLEAMNQKAERIIEKLKKELEKAKEWERDIRTAYDETFASGLTKEMERGDILREELQRIFPRLQ